MFCQIVNLDAEVHGFDELLPILFQPQMVGVSGADAWPSFHML